MLPYSYLVLTCIVGVVRGYSTGAPDFTCRDPSVFHTRKLNRTHEGIIMPQGSDSNPYRLETEARTFRPGQKITVTLYTSDSSKKLRGFFIQAVQANVAMRDLRRRAFGTFANTTSAERPSVCQQWGENGRVGGITHASNTPRRTIRVVWVAPEQSIPGPVQFVATGVLDYNTYWTDIRSPMAVRPQNYTILTDGPAVAKRWTPTAAWYHWLQYLNSRTRQASNPATAGSQSQGGNVSRGSNPTAAGTQSQGGNVSWGSNPAAAGSQSPDGNIIRVSNTRHTGQITRNNTAMEVEKSSQTSRQIERNNNNVPALNSQTGSSLKI